MKKTIIIKSPDHQKAAIANILDLDFEEIHQVIIKPYKETLSDRQRRFYFLWADLLADHFKYTKNQMHEALKGQYLFKIMLKYPDDYPEITALVNEVVAVREKGLVKEADIIARTVAPMVSITKAKVPHMKEYLDEIIGLAADNNITLPFPEERLG